MLTYNFYFSSVLELLDGLGETCYSRYLFFHLHVSVQKLEKITVIGGLTRGLVIHPTSWASV